MSTLSQFVPSGDSFLGEYVANYGQSQPVNFFVGTKEYLRTGYKVTYNSGYAPFASAFPLQVQNSPQDTVHEDYMVDGYGGTYWPYQSRIYWFKMFEQGFASGSGASYKHIIKLGYNSYAAYDFHRWGENLANPRTGTDLNGTSTLTSADQFNGRIIISGNFPPFPDAAGTGIFYGWTTSTAQAFTTSFLAQASFNEELQGCDNAVGSQLWLHNTNASTASTNGLYYTNNATSITKRTPPVDMRYTRLRTWSQMGGRFILIRENGTLLTTVDGSTVNTIAAGSITGANGGKLPTYIDGGNEMGSPRCVDHATNGTIMFIGPVLQSPGNGITKNQFLILRTTNGTSFTIEDLLPTNPNLSGFFAPASESGSAFSIPYVWFDGTRIWMWNWNFGNQWDDQFQFWSTDWGATWNGPDYGIYNGNGDRSRQYFSGFQKLNNVLYGIMSTRYTYVSLASSKIYSFDNRRMRSTPQFVGGPGMTFAQASSFSTYQRVK